MVVVVSGQSLILPCKNVIFSGRCPSTLRPVFPVMVFQRRTPPFSRARKKDFPFFPVGRPRPEPSPKPSPCRLRKSRSEVPERGNFGEENCPGKGGANRTKKGKKDAQKKVGESNGTVLGQPPQPSSEPLQTVLGQEDAPLRRALRRLLC